MRARPDILFPLYSALTRLTGIGPKIADSFAKRGFHTPLDLLLSLPERYIIRTPIETVMGQVLPDVLTLKVTPTRHVKPPKKTMPYRVYVEDGKTSLQLVFFHANEAWIKQKLIIGQPVYVSGNVEQFDGQAQMVHPSYIEADLDAIPRIEPIYPSGEGLSQKLHRNARAQLLDELVDLPEWQDAPVMSWVDALRLVHAPSAFDDPDRIASARARLVSDELLAHQLTLSLARAKRKADQGRVISHENSLRQDFLDQLPFTPTNAQIKAMDEIDADFASSQKMHRLLQGDVGAGKTLVAIMAMLSAVEAGEQAALMAPTSVLARQHFEDVKPYGDALGVKVVFLSGGLASREAKDVHTQIANGEAQIIIGTHALIQEAVHYHKLGLAIIDEQHRFGVEERMVLDRKGDAVDLLVMSATPIPRTLSLASYGDLDISILDEKPAGRQPIETAIVSQERLFDVVERLRAAMDAGRQIYWICPLVEDSEKLELTSVTARFEQLSKALPKHKIGLIHGRMSGDEKAKTMADFQAGHTQMLVATTVIEVGVNVPNASIILIDHAEHFGLSQLHQLRGRVGRGSEKSTCLLLYKAPLGKTARKRLETIRDSEDGFEIAEVDLKLRGAGDLIGLAQSGLPRFKMADLAIDQALFKQAHDQARLIASQDPELAGARGEALQILLHLMGYEAAMRRLQRG